MLKTLNRLLALVAALLAGVGLWADLPDGQRRTAPPTTGGDQAAIIERAVRRRTLAQARLAAAKRAEAARVAAQAAQAAARVGGGKSGGKSAPAALIPGGKAQAAVAAPPGVMNPLGMPDYMGGVIPNYANSPFPQVDAAGAVIPGTGIRKFVDTLPGLGPQNANNLGNYIPLAIPDTTTFPGSDFYDIGLVDYTQKLHSDLPATHLRGYKDLNAAADGAAHYLGPVILAQRDRPVRVKFNNLLPTGSAGNLKIPVDTSLMGSGAGPGGSAFSQNRGELHLHGGLNPWISDGTPHQWITPAGEPSANKKGASFANVPDMVGPGNLIPNPTAGDGIGTYFYTNQQSGRFMFYHDHAFGLTRLNVYSGEAAGYLIVDPVESKLINAGILPNNGGGVYNFGIPLIVQDKTFVPDTTALSFQDPTWDLANWGAFGDLWYPHVYMPNQNPSDPSGANAMGRWDYGPWFWPPVPVSDTQPNSIPTAHGPIPGLNPGDPTVPGTPNPSLTPEAFMDTPVVNGTAYPKMTVEPKAYRFRLLNAANDRMFGFAFYTADPANPTEVVMIPATPAESDAGPKDANGVPLWPRDGRDGGVVDWRTAGPDIIQIGNESGFLPNPVVLKSQATTYNYNRRDIVVLDIANHPLFLGPAERADIIVDFSAFAGKTLILYNDMLAPVPAFDVRYDYFTGAPDQTATGGAPPSLPGYGPNTRTLMQIQVANATPAPAFDLAALNAAFTSTVSANSAFAATQHLPIVPQTFYNNATGIAAAKDTYSTIQANQLSYTATETGLPVTMDLQPKAIQELFELDYGRMNATLGIELPFTNFNNQTTIPLGYSEPATELLTDGTTQLWKITHNGVDTHPVHFHLYDVQIVNRVGWDGAVRFPEANEVGWKETVKMKPLEDIIVAFRPLSPRLPFAIPNSTRVIDPTKDTGALITVTDLAAGSPNQGNLGNQISVPNVATDYGWEYVWHCHILGHEENDFMRPVVLTVATTAPAAATTLAATINSAAANRADLTWVDNATDETGFAIERSPSGLGTFTEIGSVVPNVTSYSDFSVAPGTAYDYRVIAYNQAGAAAASNLASVNTPATVQVSGSVYTFDGVNNLPLAGVTLAFTGGATAISDATGAYLASVPGGWTGSITPTLAGYAFTPATRAIASPVTANLTGQNFVARSATMTLSGSVLNVPAGVTVTLTTSTGATTTAAADGSFSLALPNPFTGTVTPSAAGYLFAPASRSYAGLSADLAGQTFAAQIALTGLVTYNGTGLSGVTMTYTGGSVATAADGSYSILLTPGWSGTVTPSKTGFLFTAPSTTYAALAVSLAAQNYTAAAGVEVSGQVYINTVPIQPLAGVTVAFSNGGGSAVTDANGFYINFVPRGWSGTTTPALAGYRFNPVNRSYTTVTTTQPGRNFTAQAVVTVSGKVTSNGAPLANVQVSFNNGGGTVFTDAAGNYSQVILQGWTGNINATLAGYTFNAPASYPAGITTNTTRDFYSVQTISGRTRTTAGASVNGVTVTLTSNGTPFATVVTAGQGNFTFQVPTGWSGSISASGGGYTTWTLANGASSTFTNLATNATGLRFNGQ